MVHIPPSVNWDNEQIINVLLKAGEIALDFFNNTSNKLKKDGSIVTEADIAIEAYLKSQLHNDKTGWIGEESAEALSDSELKRILTGDAYIVDPIDGTMNYANGLEMWGISIGALEQGVFKYGAIYFPCLKEMYVSGEHHVLCYAIGENKTLQATILQASSKVAFKAQEGILAVTQSIAKYGRLDFDGGIHSIACAVYAGCKVIKGSYVAYAGRLKIWDLAALVPLCKAMNIELRLLNGESFNEALDFNQFDFEVTSSHRFFANDLILFCDKSHFAYFKRLIF